MPNIKVSEDVHKRLKDMADQDYRSLGGQIEYLMDKSMGVSNILGEKVAFTEKSVDDLIQTTPSPKKSEAKSRTRGDILADIRDIEAQRDEELRYSQDPEYSKTIADAYAVKVYALWEEYNREQS